MEKNFLKHSLEKDGYECKKFLWASGFIASFLTVLFMILVAIF